MERISKGLSRSERIPRWNKLHAVVIVGIIAIGLGAAFLFLPTGDSAKVQAQETISLIESTIEYRADRLSIALDFRSAHDLAVFGGKGVIDRGGSTFRGQMPGENGGSAKADLDRSLTIINQLPCTELSDGNLRGKSFGRGVFCLPDAELAGGMTLDAQGDENAIFLFVVKGSFNARTGAGMSFVNGARASNVYFAVNEAATVADGVELGGNVLARKAVGVGNGAKVDGRAISVGDEVTVDAAQVGGGTGILEICKQQSGTGLENRIFRFRIGALIVEAPVGSCTGPIELATGSVVIEELLDGRTLPTGTFSGRFRLVQVNSPTPGALGTVNLPLRTANVFIREGDISNETIVNFVNAFAVNAVIEICKRAVAGDPDVTGFFDFTVDAIANTVFTVPVGQCSGPIQVNVLTEPGPSPQPATVRVTELSEAGFNLEAASTFPANRFIALNLGQGIVNNIACSTIGNGPVPPGCVFSNPGGGFVTASVIEGGTSNQTAINFFNRSAPGFIKVCKIAGPGIPEGTRFEFLVQGTVAGPTQPFAPGTVETRTVIVPAGPAAQGGFCNFVRDANGALTRFIVGTRTYVDEIGAIDPVPGVPPGEIRVSRIRLNLSTSGFVAAPATVPGNAATVPVIPARTVNPNPNLLTGESVFTVRREFTEVEYTNFVFRPTVLKVCKIAGPGVAVGTPFTFSVRIDDVGGLIPGQTNQPITVPNLTVQAGPASQGGFCQFVQGPFTPTATTPPVGTFNVGSRVYVTEAPVAGTTVTSITSPTGTVLACVPGDPRCGSLVLGFPDGFNELVFTNAAATTPPGEAAVRFDFDGDRKSDLSIYRPSNGTWWWAKSSANNEHAAVQWGSATDRLVAADYDGDGKTDHAIYRGNGVWYILGSRDGVSIRHFGLAGDIPQVGDYDADGKADLAVFRMSNNTWYIDRSRDGFTAMQFGLSSDIPVAADYDGDGKTDIAQYRNGTWYLMRSTEGFGVYNWGLAADRPIPADYDGDFRADAAVYRDGTWYILKSTGGYSSFALGGDADTPVPADYDGDGKTDAAIFVKSDGTWRILRSMQTENAPSTIQFGFGTDLPVPAQ